MSIWFIRCNGETAHNEPGTKRYVPGEPPRFPDRKFNYLDDCLRDGFARVGWPGAGDLRVPGWRARALETYTGLIKPHHIRFLEEFRSIKPGDIVLLPTYQRRYEVHLGAAIAPRDPSKQSGHGGAYYYFFDVAAGDWYDNAHRIDVEWPQLSTNEWRTFHLPEIGGTWIRGFGQVKADNDRIALLARDCGLHL